MGIDFHAPCNMRADQLEKTIKSLRKQLADVEKASASMSRVKDKFRGQLADANDEKLTYFKQAAEMAEQLAEAKAETDSVGDDYQDVAARMHEALTRAEKAEAQNQVLTDALENIEQQKNRRSIHEQTYRKQAMAWQAAFHHTVHIATKALAGKQGTAWISVEDRLPEKREKHRRFSVDVYVLPEETQGLMIGAYDYKDKRWLVSGMRDGWDVTHWQYKTELPALQGRTENDNG